jgi:MFS transporter, DHA1 family, multidrug resistance protein
MDAKSPSYVEFIVIAAMLIATVALSIDIMLPAIGVMADDLDFAFSNQRQWIITSLFLGLSVGQLILGPLSDAIGRRPVILLGIAVFVIGCAICARSTTFEGMMLGRVVQGFGAAGPRTATVAMIRDRFAGNAMARVMSYITGLFVLVPVLAPGLGQALLYFMPWRGLFGVLAFISLTGGAWLMLRQPETLREPRPLRVRALASAFKEVVTSARPMGYTVAAACCYGALMGYINSSQQVFQDLYRLGDGFVLVFGASAAFISAATLINAQLVRRFTMERICIVAIAVVVVWALVFHVVVWRMKGFPPLWLWMIFNCPVLFLLGLTFGNFNAIALKDLGHIAGLASAVVASLNTALSLIIAAVIGLHFDMTVGPIVLGYAGFGALALVSMLLPYCRRARS